MPWTKIFSALLFILFTGALHSEASISDPLLFRNIGPTVPENRQEKISPRLLKTLRTLPEGEAARVIVRWKAEPPVRLNGRGGSSGAPEKLGSREQLRRLRAAMHQNRDRLEAFFGERFLVDLLKMKNRLGIDRKRGEPRTRAFWVANCIAATLTPEEIQDLSRHPDLLEIVENGVLSIPPVASLDDGGTSSPAMELWNHAAIGLDALRANGMVGRGVRIGHLDTGIDAAHSEFSDLNIVWQEFDRQGQPVASSPRETHDRGHGTHTASTLVGRSTGLAPGASLISGLVLPSGFGTLEQVLAGMEWVLDPDGDPSTDDGAQVVNMSWGIAGTSPVLEEAVQNMARAGVLAVCAIGNSGPSSTYSPANAPQAVGVGAVDLVDVVGGYSGGGEVCGSSGCWKKPDMSAPGTQIWGAGAGGAYQQMTGTSMATPHVAGAAALLLEKHPGLGLDLLKTFLFASSFDLGREGFDDRYGNGRLSVEAAHLFLERYLPRRGLPDLVVETRLDRVAYPVTTYDFHFSGGASRLTPPEKKTSHVYPETASGKLTTVGVADVDGDGFGDLVVKQVTPQATGGYETKIMVYRSLNASGVRKQGEAWYVLKSLRAEPFKVVGMGDLDGDGSSDILIEERDVTGSGERVRVSGLMAADGRFVRSPGDWASFMVNGSTSLEMGLGDLNGDGKKDLVVGSWFGDAQSQYPVYYYAGLSNGSAFGQLTQAECVYPSSDGKVPRLLAMADVNGDGLDDLIVSHGTLSTWQPQNSVYVLRASGTGFLQRAALWAGMNFPFGCAILGVADMNGDGTADLMVAEKGDGGRTALRVWASNGTKAFVRSWEEWGSFGELQVTENTRVVGIVEVGFGDWRF